MMSGVSRTSTPWSLAGLVCAVAVAGEDLVPVDAAPGALGRREDPFDVDGAVRGRLCRVVDHDLAEVLLALERVRGQDPDLDEVLEVAEVVQRGQLLLAVRGEWIVVPARDLEQRRGPHRSFEMDV